MRELSVAETLRARAHAQRLGADRAGTVAGAVHTVVALQGQDVRATRLAVRARTRGLVAADVDDAVARREVVRTWAMRGTLHLLAADDLHWITGLLGPYFADRQAPRRRQLGIDEDTGCAQLEAVLAGGALTRARIVERMDLPLPGQAAPYLLAYAALTGLVCRGPELGDEPTYVLVRDWLGERPPVDADAALARLAHRYLAGYGPATAQDFAAWSGLPLGRARAGFDAVADQFEAVLAAGVPSLVAPADVTSGTRLLGHFDAYLLGYRGRDLAVPAEHAAEIQSGGGFVMPAVAVDGRVVGTWRQHATKNGLRIELTRFAEVDPEGEVDDLGRFLGRTAELVE